MDLSETIKHGIADKMNIHFSQIIFWKNQIYHLNHWASLNDFYFEIGIKYP